MNICCILIEGGLKVGKLASYLPIQWSTSMTRTTISLHESTLDKVRELSRQEHISLGEAVTELLNLGLERKQSLFQKKKTAFSLKTYSMGEPKVPLEDKEAINRILDKE
jgi:hypothetical protein